MNRNSQYHFVKVVFCQNPEQDLIYADREKTAEMALQVQV